MTTNKVYKIIFILFVSQVFRPCMAQQAFEIQTYFGVHQMDLKWSIAGDIKGAHPNVLSELMWRNLKGPMIGFKFSRQITNKLTAKLDFNFADITYGFATDADYAADNRKQNFYKQEFKSDRGSDLSLKTTIAYKLFTFNNLKISPFLGFDLRKQQVFLFDLAPGSAKFFLNSNYKNTWEGGIVGLNTRLTKKMIKVNLSVAGSFLSYNAEAKWNLIPQFIQPVSFRHEANALAIHGDMDANYALNKNFSTTITIGAIHAKSFKGTDEAYYVSKSPVQTQLNEVKSSSYKIGVGFNYLF